jgi:hypothetical protein
LGLPLYQLIIEINNLGQYGPYALEVPFSTGLIGFPLPSSQRQRERNPSQRSLRLCGELKFFQIPHQIQLNTFYFFEKSAAKKPSM